MLILNLAHPEKPGIPFNHSKFPDGQQSITILRSPSFVRGREVKIYSRLNTFRDLEIIVCANQALRGMGVSSVSLYSPYFMGARSDRKFTEGGVNYLKQVICPIINSQNFDKVTVLDPHSDVLEACLDRYEKIDNHSIVKQSLTKIDNKDGAQDRIVLVSPDAGAYKKIFDVAKKFSIKNIITASKHRDIETGKITSTELPDISRYGENHKFVIVDDICDGGRTFVELAKEIRKHNSISDIYLIVTHGIFSAGFEEIGNYFTKIYSSNSYSDIENSQLTQFNVF